MIIYFLYIIILSLLLIIIYQYHLTVKIKKENKIIIGSFNFQYSSIEKYIQENEILKNKLKKYEKENELIKIDFEKVGKFFNKEFYKK